MSDTDDLFRAMNVYSHDTEPVMVTCYRPGQPDEHRWMRPKPYPAGTPAETVTVRVEHSDEWQCVDLDASD